jgi:lipopolysaccharide biosynthesis glycosyltransferase
MIKIFIGYDEREPVAFHTCVDSIIKHASEPVEIVPLALRHLSMFYLEEHTDGSNDFIYSRFLVPYLCGFNGFGIYVDGDMVFRNDIAKLWELRDPWMAAQVVKHDYKTKATQKYLGAKNEDYPCKNWSSVILWNCGHYANRQMLPETISAMTGAQLHRFSWLPDERLGELPLLWNWLAEEYDHNDNANLHHYTLGTPCWEEYAGGEAAKLWHDAYMNMSHAEDTHAGAIASRAIRYGSKKESRD